MQRILRYGSALSRLVPQVGDMRRLGLAVLLLAGRAASWLTGAPAQEPSSRKDAGSAGAQSGRERRPGARGGGTARVPDALKFANGLLRQKKYDLAAEEYERFAELRRKGPDLDDARFGLANARLYQGNFREARRAFDDFLKAAPDDPRRLTARYRLGELAYLLGDLPAARRSLEEFTAATVDHPGLEMAWTYLGDTCFGLQDFPRARQAYERSLSAYPKGRLAERAKYGLGRTLAALGNRDRALTVLQELAEQANPEWVDRAWLQIGLIRKSAGQFAEAVEAFTALERAAPRSALRSEAQLQHAPGLGSTRADRARPKRSCDRWRPMPPLPKARGPRLELATIELERNHPDAALTTLDVGD